MSPRVILLGLIVLATGGFVAGTTLERNSGESKHESAATLKAEGVSAATNAAVGGESNAVHAAEAKRRGGETATTPATTTPTTPESGASHAAEHKSAATPNTNVEASNDGESVAAHATEQKAPPSTSTATRGPARGRTAPSKPAHAPVTHAATKTPAPAAALPTSMHHAELKPLGINVEAVPFVILAALGSLTLGGAAWLRPRSALLLVGVGAAMLLFAALDVRELFHQSDESKTGLAVLAGAIAAMHAAAAAVAGSIARRANTGDPAAGGATITT